MPHYPKPYFRSQHKLWYVQFGGCQVNLGRDRDEAFRRYHDMMARGGEQPKTAVGDSVVSILDAYLDWCQKHRAPRTYDWYRDYLQSFAQSIPPDLTVDRLKPFHVQQWLDGKPAWRTGKRGAVIAVQRAFNWATRMGLIAQNPVRSVEKPKAGRREQVITPDRFALILSLVRDEEFRDLLTVCWETGCRPQEAMAVEARHVDLKAGCWVFPAEEAKGKRQRRVVYLTDRALDITRRRMTENPRGPMMRNTNGQPWSASSLNCRFSRLRLALGKHLASEAGFFPPKLRRLTEAQRREPAIRSVHEAAQEKRHREIIRIAKELAPRYSLYTLRHSWCTHALERGVDAVTVATLMGHRDTTMISRVYAHLMQRRDHLREAVRKAAIL